LDESQSKYRKTRRPHKGIQRALQEISRMARFHFTKYFFVLGLWPSERWHMNTEDVGSLVKPIYRHWTTIRHTSGDLKISYYS
jgi:hypothetical protein